MSSIINTYNLECKGPETIIILIDTSMGNMSKCLITGVNQFIQEQKIYTSNYYTNPNFLIYSSSNKKIKSSSLKNIEYIKEDEVQYTDETLLSDSIGHIIEENIYQKNVLFLIFAGGTPDSSLQYKGIEGFSKIKRMVNNVTTNNNWNVIFGSTNINAYNISSMYGITNDNSFYILPHEETLTNIIKTMSKAMYMVYYDDIPLPLAVVREVSEEQNNVSTLLIQSSNTLSQGHYSDDDY